MKSLINILFLVVLFVLTACPILDKNSGGEVSKKVINKSNYSISMYIYQGNNTVDTLLLALGEEIEHSIFYIQGKYSSGNLPIEDADSVKVNYNNTVSITHKRYPSPLNTVLRNLLQTSTSWTKTEDVDNKKQGEIRRYEYVFTNDDYNEASYEK